MDTTSGRRSAPDSRGGRGGRREAPPAPDPHRRRPAMATDRRSDPPPRLRRGGGRGAPGSHRTPDAARAAARPPVGWMLVVYIGALRAAVPHVVLAARPLLVAGRAQWGFRTTRRSSPIRRTGSPRCGRSAIAAAVTLTDIVLAFPLAYYAARIAKPRRRALILLAVVLPLWSQLPGSGVRLADDPRGRRPGAVAPAAGLRAGPRHVFEVGGLDHVHLPVAAVRHPADLRGDRTHPAVVAGGERRPGRRAVDDVPQGDLAARASPGSWPVRSSRSR